MKVGTIFTTQKENQQAWFLEKKQKVSGQVEPTPQKYSQESFKQ